MGRHEVQISFSEAGPWVPLPNINLEGIVRQLDRLRSRQHLARVLWYTDADELRGTTYLWWGQPHDGPRGLKTDTGPRVGMQVLVQRAPV